MAGSIKFFPGKHDGYTLSQQLVERAQRSEVHFPKKISIFGCANDWFVVSYTTRANKKALLDAAKEMKITVLEIR